MRKVTLKVYSRSDKEDCEHFFECFEKLQREMEDIWMDVRRNKTNDAKALFTAFEHMLTGTATSEWHDVISGTVNRTWEDFKVVVVSKFICEKRLRSVLRTMDVIIASL